MEAYFGLEKPVVRPLKVVGVVRVVFQNKGIFNDNKNNRNNIFCLIPPYPPNSPGERSEGCYLVVMFGGLKYCGYFFDAFQQVVKRRVVAGCL